MKDKTLWGRAQDCIAQGALTNSKHPARHVMGVYPTHIQWGSQAGLWDGEKYYADYICGLGTNLLGYNNGHVVEAVKRALEKGFSHSLPTVYEVETAEYLKSIFHWVDKWKFLKTGSEAASAAIKIARAYTGRRFIASHGYHGWSDEFVSLTPPAIGVHSCEDIINLEGFLPDHIFIDGRDPTDFAAIIIEPVITDWSPKRQAYLNGVREFCNKYGILLIFDEIITGLRFLNYSVSRYFGVTPDILLLGKALANGLPLAAVGGKAAVMDGNYFVSSTYAGEILSLAAAKAVLETLTTRPHFSLPRLWEKGGDFIKRFNNMADGSFSIEGYPTRGIFQGAAPALALLRQEACKASILLGPSWFYNFDLIANDFLFFEFLGNFMKRFKLNQIKLEGQMPTSAFAEAVRGRT